MFDRLQQVGHTVLGEFLALQGDGDLGDTLTTDDGQTLYRSREPVAGPLRTNFGQHEFWAYVYRPRRHAHTPIVLRPVDARMSLAPSRWSQLMEPCSKSGPGISPRIGTRSSSNA